MEPEFIIVELGHYDNKEFKLAIRWISTPIIARLEGPPTYSYLHDPYYMHGSLRTNSFKTYADALVAYRELVPAQTTEERT